MIDYMNACWFLYTLALTSHYNQTELKLLLHNKKYEEIIFFSCAEPDYCILVQRQGAGDGLWHHTVFLTPGQRSQLLSHKELPGIVWPQNDIVGW